MHTVARPARLNAPRARRGFISGAFLAIAAIVAIAGLAAAPAQAQTARTYTFTAHINGGPACTACQANEGDELRLELRVNGISSGGVSWNTVTFAGSATATAGEDNDYTGGGAFQAGAFTAADESTLTQRSYPITDDATPEVDETITVGVPVVTATDGNPDTYTTTSAAITITIAANDGNGFTITANQTSVNEADAPTITFTVSMTGQAISSGSRSVRWDVSGVTPLGAGADLASYPAQRTLNFTSLGERTVTLMVANDDLAEIDETLTVTLSNPTGSTPPPTLIEASAGTEIVDNDRTRTLTVTGPDSIAENDATAGAESANYTVTLSGAAFAAGTTVTWTVAHGSTTDADFVDASDRSGTVTFGTGDGDASTKTFTLSVAGDELNEADETFTVNVSVATQGSTAYGAAHTTTITDDDDITRVAIGGANSDPVSEGDSADFIVKLDHASAGVVTVAWTAEIENARGGQPTPLGGNLAIPAGQTAAAISISIPLTLRFGAGDSRTLTVTPGAVTVAPPGRGGAAVTGIAGEKSVNYNNLVPGVARTYTFTARVGGVECTACRVNEGDSFSLSIGISGISSGQAAWNTVDFTGSATAGDDYTGGDGFQAGAFRSDDESIVTTRTFDIEDDDATEDTEPDETIIVAVPVITATDGNPDTYTTTSAAITITIAANDGNIFAIEADAASVAENAGDITFTVSLTGEAFSGSRSVDWAVSGVDTAADLMNYPTSRTLTFTGLGEQTITLSIADDSTAEVDETLTVTLSMPSGDATLSATATSANTVIQDNDDDRRLTVTGPANITENDDAAAGQRSGDYTITLDGTAFSADTTVTWTVSHVGTTNDDFVAAGDRSGSVTFGASDGDDSTKTFTLDVAGDELNEAAEAFTVQVSVDAMAGGVTNYGPPARTTITDDDPVQVAITRASGSGAVGEGSGALNFTVTITGGTRASGVNTIMPFTVTGLSADEFDITAPAAAPPASATRHSITILHDDPSGTITVTLQDDDVNEAHEMVTITGAPVGASGLLLSGTAGTFGAVQYTTGGDTAGVEVTDDDDITMVTVGNGADVTEGGSTTFTVTIDHASAGIVTVSWRAAISGDAMGGAPAPASGIAAIPAGGTTGRLTIRIPPNADLGESDGTRTLTVTLGRVDINAPGRGSVTTTDTGTATVSYLDAAHTISIADAAFAEGAANITVTRTGPALTTPATITWTVSAGTATADDFAGGALPQPAMVTFPAGSATTQTITVGVADDALSEMDETFTIALSADDATLSSNAGIQLGAAATITITDNDAISVTIGGPRSVGEARTVRFPVTLTRTPTADLTLNWAVAGAATGDLQAATAGDFADTAGGSGAAALPAGMLTFTGGATSRIIELHTSDGGGGGTPNRAFTLTLSGVSGGGGSMTPADPPPVTVTISEDDPAAREARLEVPLMSAGRGVAQLAAAAVAGRLRTAFGPGDAANSLNLAGRELMRGRGAETLAAELLARGYATGEAELTVEELLRGGGFNLTGGAAGREFNLWGGGGMLIADGKHGGVDYDGDTTAFHFGLDTAWRGGLAGVALGRSSGEVDFTAAGVDYELQTSVTGMHPYFGRRHGRTQMWATAGLGSGEAELKEPDTRFKTDIVVTTAAAGLSHARADHLTANLSALYTRAELDNARAGGNALNAMSVNSLRLAANAAANWQSGAWRPFVDFTVRHDSGDGDTGIAGDLGGGFEWRAPTVVVRLTAATTVAAKAAEETHAQFTAQKSAGNFGLSLNLATDSTGNIDTGKLVTGEWRF